MRGQRGYSAFPTTFLTFSLLLLVLAAGFAVGRLVVGRAYIKSAGQFDRLPIPKADTSGQASVDADQPAGQGYVPEPADQSAKKDDQSMAEPPVDQDLNAPKDEAPPDAAPASDQQNYSTPVETPKPGEDKNERRYAIQVGLFESEQSAQQLADDLARAGYPARVDVGKGDNGRVYRVLTGRYRTEYAARKAMDQLRQEGFPGFLVDR